MLILLTSTSISALLQLQPDIIVAKISERASPEQVLCEMMVSTARSDPHSHYTTSDIVAAMPHHDHAWCIGNLLGTLCYRRMRYKVVKRRDPEHSQNLQEKEEIHVEYYWPSWLVNRVWKIQAVKVLSGWTLSPRAHNIVAYNSLVFEYAKMNDLTGLQTLFSMKLASPLDRTEMGMTPLMVNIHFMLYGKLKS